MSRQLWHWNYFEKHPSTCVSSEKHNHTTNQHYPKAWCRACILNCVESLRQKDLEDVKHGVLSEVRSNDKLRTQAFLVIPSVSGRREGFEPHIRSCKWIDSEAKASLARERTRSAPYPGSLSPGSARDGSSDSGASTQPACGPIHGRLSKEQQSELESDLCKLWVANGWAWHSINGPETQAFFQKWFPAIALPDRHKLSGPILQRELESANSSMKHAICGRLATGMSDGWKNIKRSYLITSMLSVDYVTYTVKVHDVSAEHKTADHHLSLVLSDIEFAEKEQKVRVIAWVSDAGGESRAMRVRLNRLYPHILVFDCWAHQINLVVGDILAHCSRLVDTADAAIAIIKWMLNHSYLLGLLRQEQIRNGATPRSLTLPVLTRWTSHFLSFRSLLSESPWIRSLAARNPDAFRASAGRSAKKKEEIKIILKNIEDPHFWNRLAELKLIWSLSQSQRMSHRPRRPDLTTFLSS